MKIAYLRPREERSMRYGVPIIGDRVAPRCTYADGFLVVTADENGAIRQYNHETVIRTPADLTETLSAHNIETLIAGGVGRAVRNRIEELDVAIVDNVSKTVAEVVQSIADENGGASIAGASLESAPCLRDDGLGDIDCINCTVRACVKGGRVSRRLLDVWDGVDATGRRIVEAALDISAESPRQLCRLAEVIYFCLEMRYHRIGLAYCTDLADAAGILTTVLRRFFTVVPVCCKVGGMDESHLFSGSGTWQEADASKVVCNPIGQAYMLNHAKTEFNIVVGLCVGMDALFFRAVKAPSTTLFVKDKTLANNPIGALYSEYYLNETVAKAPRKVGNPSKNTPPEET